jgi:hypothetical protein
VAVRGPATVNVGTVFVRGSQITLSNGGAAITVTWSLSHGRLVLDGQTYMLA